jgi:hypothetical protein
VNDTNQRCAVRDTVADKMRADPSATLDASFPVDSCVAPAAAGTVSRRSLLSDNANLRERSRRLEQHARSLEDRLSELLGTQISQHTGLGPPPDIAALNDQIQALQQENLGLRRHAEEREEELAAAREANRRLMTELNHPRALSGSGIRDEAAIVRS